MLLKMRTKAFVLIGIGTAWFLLVAWGLAVRNVIFRETVLGIIARMIDKLPSPFASLAFAVSWCALLFGWCIPVIIGLRLLRSRK